MTQMFAFFHFALLPPSGKAGVASGQSVLAVVSAPPLGHCSHFVPNVEALEAWLSAVRRFPITDVLVWKISLFLCLLLVWARCG